MRDRDSMAQDRVAIDQLLAYLRDRIPHDPERP